MANNLTSCPIRFRPVRESRSRSRVFCNLRSERCGYRLRFSSDLRKCSRMRSETHHSSWRFQTSGAVPVPRIDESERFDQWNTGESSSRSHGWPFLSMPPPKPYMPSDGDRNRNPCPSRRTAVRSWTHEQRRVKRDVKPTQRTVRLQNLGSGTHRRRQGWSGGGSLRGPRAETVRDKTGNARTRCREQERSRLNIRRASSERPPLYSELDRRASDYHAELSAPTNTGAHVSRAIRTLIRCTHGSAGWPIRAEVRPCRSSIATTAGHSEPNCCSPAGRGGHGSIPPTALLSSI